MWAPLMRKNVFSDQIMKGKKRYFITFIHLINFIFLQHLLQCCSIQNYRVILFHNKLKTFHSYITCGKLILVSYFSPLLFNCSIIFNCCAIASIFFTVMSFVYVWICITSTNLLIIKYLKAQTTLWFKNTQSQLTFVVINKFIATTVYLILICLS